MSILAWIEDQRTAKLLDAPKYNHKDSTPSSRSVGLWTRCDNCGVILYIKHLKENIRVCFGCGYHLQMESTERISSLIDAGTWRPLDETLSPVDPLHFKDQKPYVERLKDAQKKTGLQDAIQTGTGLLNGIPIALGVMDFHFMGGSMGSVVGEKITRLIEYATGEGYTLVLVCASGGARMQEGIYSLMQMAKISSALHVYQSCANLLYISVITSPTTGGVTASFAMLGDLVFAEPKALIGFAGRRVIEQTLQEELPNDFQTAEYLLHHGLLDLIVPRCFLKAALAEIIYLYKNAPRKRSGYIPYGVANPLSFLEVESILRSLEENEKSSSFLQTDYPILSESSDDVNKVRNQKTNVEKEWPYAFFQSPVLKTTETLESESRVSSITQKTGWNAPVAMRSKEVQNPLAQKTTSGSVSSRGLSQGPLGQGSLDFQSGVGTPPKTFSSKKLSFKTLFDVLNIKNVSPQSTDWLGAIELATTQKICWINQNKNTIDEKQEDTKYFINTL